MCHAEHSAANWHSIAYGHMIALTNYKPALNQFFYTLFLSQSKPISL